MRRASSGNSAHRQAAALAAPAGVEPGGHPSGIEERDDHCDDQTAGRADGEVTHEFDVDLEEVDREVLAMGETGVSGAELIQSELATEAAQALRDAPGGPAGLPDPTTGESYVQDVSCHDHSIVQIHMTGKWTNAYPAVDGVPSSWSPERFSFLRAASDAWTSARVVTVRTFRSASLAALIGVGLLGAVSPAWGDGDPASDTLIVQSVFYPYSTSVPRSSQRALNAAVTDAARAGEAVKVALIAHPSDLGSITALFGRPQRYADFLHTEISYARSVRLLVVMAGGNGAAGFPPSVARRLRALPPAGAGTGAALAAEATKAIRAVTASAGRAGPRPAAAASGNRSRAVILLLLILAAVLVSGAIVILRVFFAPVEPQAEAGTHIARGGGRKDRARARSRRLR